LSSLEIGGAHAAIHLLPSLSPFQGRETYKERLGNTKAPVRAGLSLICEKLQGAILQIQVKDLHCSAEGFSLSNSSLWPTPLSLSQGVLALSHHIIASIGTSKAFVSLSKASAQLTDTRHSVYATGKELSSTIPVRLTAAKVRFSPICTA